MKRSLRILTEEWPIRGVFRIARGSSTSVRVLVVELEEDGFTGRGEASPQRYGMNVEKAVADIDWLDSAGQLVARMSGYQCVVDASLNDAFRRNTLNARRAAGR